MKKKAKRKKFPCIECRKDSVVFIVDQLGGGLVGVCLEHMPDSSEVDEIHIRFPKDTSGS